MLGFVRFGIGIVLSLVFAAPLAIIAKRPALCKEPLVMLVINMTFTAFSFGFLFTIGSTVDMVTGDNTPELFCLPFISIGTSTFVAIKLSTLFLAVDQFVAIVYPLHHCAIMSRWVKKMITLNWLFVLAHGLFSMISFLSGLESTLEFDKRVFGVEHHVTQCRWERMPHVYMLSVEICLLLFSVSTCALLIYTAVQGIKHERRIAQDDITSQTQHFVTHFKSFKRIVKVLMILVVIDIVGGGLRIGSRWLMPTTLLDIIHHLRALSVISECWVYGYNSTTVRNAITAFFSRPSEEQDREPRGDRSSAP